MSFRPRVKRLIYLFLLLLPVLGAAQSTIPVKSGSPTIDQIQPRAQFKLSFGIPVVHDTTAAMVGTLDSLGLIIQVRSTGVQYKRDTIPGGGHFWNPIVSGSGGVTSASGAISGTASGTNLTTTLNGRVVQDSNLAYMPSKTVKGNDSSAAGPPKNLTAAQLFALMNLGTAAIVSVPSSGNATSSQAVLGSDTRLSDARDAKSLQTIPISATPPVDGQVLQYSSGSGQYTPTTPSSGSGTVNTNNSVTGNGTSLSPVQLVNDISSGVLKAYGFDAGGTRGFMSLGTAAFVDKPVSGNASSTQVVMGNDTRLGTGGITTASGDASGTASGTNLPLTLATVNGAPGTYGSATAVPQITVNAKGLAPSVGTISIQIAESQVTNLTTDLGNRVTNPMTTANDIIIGGSGGTPQRLAAGGTNTVFHGNGSYGTVANADMTNMAAAGLKGATGAGAVQDLTPSQAGGMINLSYLADVLWGNLANGNIPVYNSSTSKWVNGTNWPQEQPWGIIYNKSSWTNLYNFNLNGGLTASLNSGFVDFTPASNGTYTNFALIGLPTTLANLTITDIVKAPTATTTSYGGGIGLYSANKANGTGSRFDVLGRIDFSSNSTAGQLILDKSTATNITTSGATRLSWSGGDLIKRTFAYSDTSVTFTVQNLTTAGSPISLTYNYTSAPGYAFDAPNTSYLAEYFMSPLEIQAVTISSSQIKNPTIVIDGDSKTKGYYCTHWNDRLSYLLNATYGTTTIYAGGYDRVREHLSYSLNDNLRMNARYVIMNIGSNSPRVGESLASVEAQYDSLTNYHLSTGAIVLHMVMPEDSTGGGIGLTNFKNYIASKYASTYIDVWDSLTTYSGGVSNNILKSIYNPSGGVHPNSLGNAKAYQAIVASGLIFPAPTASRTGQLRNAGPNMVVTRDSSWIDPVYDAYRDSIAAHTGSSISGLTTNTIPKANSSTSLTNSRITDDGTTITLPGNTVAGAPGLSGTVALRVKGATDLNYETYAFSGYMHQLYTNDARNAGVRAVIFGYPLGFGTWDGTTESEWMRISTGGRLLLNTTTDNGSDQLQVNGSTLLSGKVTFKAPTTSIPTANFPSGSFPTSPSDGDWGHAPGHLYFRDNTTTYDLLAGTGYSIIQNAASSVTARAKINFPSASGGPQLTATDNSGNGSTDITIANLASTTYTPTLTVTSGTATLANSSARYIRQGTVVIVHGTFDVTSATAGSVAANISIPVSTSSLNAYGSGSYYVLGTLSSVFVRTLSSNVNIIFTASATGSTVNYNFSYDAL